MATEVGQDALVFSGWITWEELVGVEVRELDVLSDKKSQAPPVPPPPGLSRRTRVNPGVGGGEEAAVSFVSCTAQTTTPSEWSMVTSSLLELRMPLQLNWTNWAVKLAGDKASKGGHRGGHIREDGLWRERSKSRDLS